MLHIQSSFLTPHWCWFYRLIWFTTALTATLNTIGGDTKSALDQDAMLLSINSYFISTEFVHRSKIHCLWFLYHILLEEEEADASTWPPPTPLVSPGILKKCIPLHWKYCLSLNAICVKDTLMQAVSCKVIGTQSISSR